MKKSILLIISVFTLLSCDPRVDYSRIIENQTDYHIEYLLIDTSNMQVTDSSLVESKTEYLTEFDNQFGTPENYENCESFFSGEIRLRVSNDSSLFIKIDPNETENWIFTLLDGSLTGSGICECRLTITNEDLN